MTQNPYILENAPAFAKPLLPYIKTREATLKIRRILTLHLQSQLITSGDNPNSHISLCTLQGISGVKTIPSEFGNGLRSQYLKALQANTVARKEYSELLKETESLTESLNHDTEPQSVPDSQELQNYLSLLRSRQRQKKIQICQHYLDRLNSMKAADANYLEMARETQNILSSSGQLLSHQSGLTGVTNPREQRDGLLHELERAVISSTHRVDNEKELLRTLRADGFSSNNPSPRAKLNALLRVRDELVQWIEHTLASSGMEDASIVEEEYPGKSSDTQAAMSSLENLKSEIEHQYELYIQARQRLLASVSAASRLPLKSPSKLMPPKAELPTRTRTSKDYATVFPYIYENLYFLSKAQKTVTIQRLFLSALLSKEKFDAEKVFERLQNESHLLPEYLTRESRFKPVSVANINLPDSTDRLPGETQESEVVTHAKAWATASKTAHDVTKQHVDHEQEVGIEAVRNAETTLNEVFDLMGQDYKNMISPGSMVTETEKDIWTMDTSFSRKKATRSKQDRRPRGPWSKIDGAIGIANLD